MLRRELRDLGLSGLSEVPGGVLFRGTIADGMRATLWSRIAMRVLLEIGRDRVHGQAQLYAFVRNTPIDTWFGPDSTIAVYATTSDEQFRDSRFAGMKTKDAIVDAVRARYGRRPDVAPKDPDIAVALHLRDGDARLYLDLAGDPLNQRGARSREVDAPLKENVAAALLQYSGWDLRAPLHDPTCGGGTIALEAAMMARNVAPGLSRAMKLERWPVFAKHLAGPWKDLRTEAVDRQRTHRGVIIASDIDRKAVAATRTNLAGAGHLDAVIVREADARLIDPLRGGGFIVFNPPYGERIGGDDREVAALYARLAERMLGFPDHTVALISTTHALAEGFGGAEPTRAVEVLNGKLRCQMMVYAP